MIHLAKILLLVPETKLIYLVVLKHLALRQLVKLKVILNGLQMLT